MTQAQILAAPARTVAGWTGVVVATALWAALLAIPWLPCSGAARAAVAGIVLATAEALFWAGAVCLGPDLARVWRRLVSRVRGEPPAGARDAILPAGDRTDGEGA